MKAPGTARIVYPLESLDGPRPVPGRSRVTNDQAVLARAITDVAARGGDERRLAGLCEAYVLVMRTSVAPVLPLRDDDAVARVVEAAREDLADWETTQARMDDPLTYYLWLTEDQAEAADDVEELTRARGRALAEYKRRTGATLRAIEAELRTHGYDIWHTGVRYLINLAGPVDAAGRDPAAERA